jgi:hypothetical protein
LWEFEHLPVEIGLEMYAEKPVVMPFFTGHVARGLLLHFVRQVDPAASGLLHELNVTKPYNVTPLRFRSSNRGEDGYVLDPAFPCRVGFRFLKDEYATYLLNFFQKHNTALVFDTTFTIASMSVNCKSYADLEKESQAVVLYLAGAMALAAVPTLPSVLPTAVAGIGFTCAVSAVLGEDLKEATAQTAKS